jgi:HK97 family phage prohead protease
MNKTTFVVSDESVNSYGLVILTSGIDTAKFERNPVMLYMHERKTVVGRWENIRKDGKRLLADAVFDDSTPLGVQVKNQVEKGFLRSASIGVEIIEKETVNGVETVTKSVLTEISIVDIPSNSNALKLYRKGGRMVLRLALSEKVDDLRAAIINLLGLDEDITNEDILAEIQALTNAPDDATVQVDEAIRAGYVDAKDRNEFLTMARVTPGTYRAFVSGERRKREKAVFKAVDNATRERRISYPQKELYARIGLEMGLETLSEMLTAQPKQLKLSELIGGNRDGWTLEDYRRYAPDDLRKNPKLYEELIDREGGETVNGKKTLDWYRKHNPEYLKEHPEVYEKLIANI